MSKVIILLGSAGSGKGTQGQRLIDRFGWRKIETGEIIRRLAREDSELGRQMKQIHASGLHVSDQEMASIMEQELATADTSKGLLLDGYPRTLAQAEILNGILSRLNLLPQTVAVFINVPIEEARQRLSSRAVCTVCGAIYMTRDITTCTNCGGKVEARDYDASLDSINKRLAFFETQVLPVIDYYRGLGKLIEVNGQGTIDVVDAEIIEKLSVYERIH